MVSAMGRANDQSNSSSGKGGKPSRAPSVTASVLKPAGGRQHPRRLGRVIAALVFIVLLGGLEYAARVHDGNTHFRFQLLKALEMLHTVSTPQAACPDEVLNWPKGFLLVRDAQDNPPPAEPFVVGGKIIAGAQPNPNQRAIHANQLQGEKLILILGESAAFGYPLGYGDSFGALMEAELQPAGYKVLNAAEPGCASATLVPIAHRIVDEFKPQALILYMGNNEWIHWGPKSETPNAWVFRVATFLAHSRVLAYGEYLVARRMAMRAHSPAAFAEQHELTGFEYALEHPMAGPLPEWEETKRSFLANFEANLLDIINHAKANQVRVILATVPFSYRLSPAWMHPQPLATSEANHQFVQQNLQQAAAAYRKKAYPQALEILDRALAREPSIPVLHYLRAAALEAAGKPAEAEAAYASCRENMVGHLGSPLSINQTIRKLAAETKTELVDLQALFDEQEHGAGHHFNDDLIMDDCHPTPLGHRLIASALTPLFLPAK
jgi:lysophospholipase L1-like esterase